MFLPAPDDSRRRSSVVAPAIRIAEGSLAELPFSVNHFD
jgi:hypothetical protein